MKQIHPGLNLINLKFLLDTARFQSVSLAAKSNFVTQSAVSQGIQKLEKAVGVPLTMHQKNKFLLTDAGKQVVDYCLRIFNLVDEMCEQVKSEEVLLSGNVLFGCPISIARTWLPLWIQETKKKYPSISLNMQVMDFDNLLNGVRMGKMEFGIGIKSYDPKEFDSIPLYRGKFNVYSRGLEIDTGIYVDSLENPDVRIFCRLYQERHKKPLNISGETHSWELILKLIENGIGCGYIPDFLLGKKSEKTIKPCKSKIAPMPYEIVAFFLKGKRLSSRSRAVLELFASLNVPY